MTQISESSRYRITLENDALLAKFGVVGAEKEPSKVSLRRLRLSGIVVVLGLACHTADWTERAGVTEQLASL